MSGGCQSTDQQLCGCCAGVQSETPEVITNRPALSAISYRIGRYSTFYASMLAALSDSNLPALAPLRTRDSSDFSIAFLDTWAVVCDILTFYQERLANEAYLRCAIDDRSVMELAALVGYRPSPGVAASAMLAFSLNSAPGAPDNVTISAGTRVQSVPGPGQMPQVFETSSAFVALIKQNQMAVQTSIPWGLSNGQTSIWIDGTSNNLNPGDALLFVNQALHEEGLSGSTKTGAQADLHFVSSVQVNSQSKQTLVVWDTPLTWPSNNDGTAFIYVWQKRAALFGAQSIDPRALTVSTTAGSSGLVNVTGWPATGTSPATGDWTFTAAFTSPAINLDASYPGLAPGKNPSAEPQWVVLINPGQGSAVFNVQSAAETSPNAFLLTSKTTQLTLANGLTIGTSPTQAGSTYLTAVVGDTRNTTAYVQSSRLTPVDPPYLPTATLWPFSNYAVDPMLLLPVYEKNLEIAGGQQLTSGQPIAINGNRLRMQIAKGSSASQAIFSPNGSSTALNASDGQIFLIDAFPSIPDPASGDPIWQVLTTKGVAGELNAEDWSITLLPSDAKNDPSASEAAIISSALTEGDITTLVLTSTLARAYDRSTVTVNANVVAATNGETTNEILGNGDATNSALEFTLKQSPLTYVPSSLSSGSVSTLQVWVNNLRWSETPNFLSAGSADRVFVTSVNADGTVNVEFGNGITGSRPPTGQMNIRAVYRKGIGSAGNVATGQLSMPLDRPQGLQTVTNPQPATGGADPDTAEDARISAPLQVQTIGRVVSLEDYQNYALAFAGVAKALATWTWFGRTRGVLLTIAGENGGVFKQTDLTVTNLIASLISNGSPYVPIQVVSYTPVLFEVGATIQIDTTQYDSKLVLAAVWQALAGSYNFSSRQLGYGIAQSQIIQTIQQVPGAIALELTQFNRQDQATAPPLQQVLPVYSPLNGLDTGATAPLPQGAELLTLDPASQANLLESK
jgi:hypothetical protein